jgi:hypothetical protein
MRAIIIATCLLSSAAFSDPAPWFSADPETGICTPLGEAYPGYKTPEQIAADELHLLGISNIFLWNGPNFLILSPIAAPSPGAQDEIFMRGIAQCQAWLKVHKGQHPYTMRGTSMFSRP